MSKSLEQRSGIKICFRNGINATETLKMIQRATCDESLSSASIFDCHRLFKEGRESVEDECRSHQHQT